MSYLALARKYRPKRFEDVRGQQHAVRALAHALDADRLHPALLLTGTRGVGKTTLGRLIAKGLNCERGVGSKPCGECSACRELDGGRCIDLIEIDAASRTKVDDTRALLDNVAYAPVRGRYKVYLIDEVHMLSTSSFNALLKTLEEPPAHVKFILATTDPQKLPATVLSRCLQFSLKRLPTPVIREALADVLRQEAASAEAAALAELARAADGSLRDGLSLLDQGIAYAGGGELSAEMVEQMLGGVGRRQLLELIAALAGGDGARLLAGLKALERAAPDYAALSDRLAATLQRLAVLQILPDALDEDDDPALPELAQRLPAEEVQLYYEIAVHGRRDLPWAPDPRLGFEMTLLRMFAFRPVDGPVADSSNAASQTGAKPRAAAARSAPGGAAPAAPAAATTSADITSGGRSALPDDAAGWAQRVEALGLDGLTRQLALNCTPGATDERGHELLLDPRARHLLTEPRRDALQRALAQRLQPAPALSIRIADQPLETPAALADRAEAQRLQQAGAALAADPTVRALQERLGATIQPGSVRLLGDTANQGDPR
ncbi:MAG: DNA polymerase III subunit gamma/tau [Gammaproteobacteria bacterium]|nr:DNA polymerase III subunit gamma/tau [Gammaproteobacteria bacterium]